MPVEPAIKRTVIFIDGQNLFRAAREAFGYTYPNYDVLALVLRARRAATGAGSTEPTGSRSSVRSTTRASTGGITGGDERR